MNARLEPYKDGVIQAYRDGASLREIADTYDVYHRSVALALERWGIRCISAKASGKPAGKVTDRPVKLVCANGWETPAHEKYRRQIYGEARY